MQISLYLTFLSNIFTAFSDFFLLIFLLTLFWKWKAVVNYLLAFDEKLSKELMLIANIIQYSLCLVISIDGLTHILGAFEYFDANHSYVVTSRISIFILSIVYLLSTFLIVFSTTSPYFRIIMEQFNLSCDGFMQLVSVLERMQKNILIFNADLKVKSVSSSMTEEYFGVNNYIGLSIFELISSSEDICKFQDAFQKLDSETFPQDTITIEFMSKGNTNNIIWLESKIRRDKIRKPNGKIEIEYTMITRNIDNQKKSELLLQAQEANKLQESLIQSKLMYVTSVVHDLKAPLQTFCFGVELFRQTLLTTSQNDILMQLTVASDMMKLSISQSIDIGKSLDNRLLTPRKTNISLSEIIDQVRVIMTGIGSAIPISYTISPFINDTIITDREWLWQMLLNLLTNACKYTIVGFISVTVDLINNNYSNNNNNNNNNNNSDYFVLFQVTDTGIGVSDSKKSTIFDAFNQAQVGQVTGTGLGLYGLRCRVEALGGICGVKDNEGYDSGSVFWFQIPYIPYGSTTSGSTGSDSTSGGDGSTRMDIISKDSKKEDSNLFGEMKSTTKSLRSSFFSSSKSEVAAVVRDSNTSLSSYQTILARSKSVSIFPGTDTENTLLDLPVPAVSFCQCERQSSQPQPPNTQCIISDTQVTPAKSDIATTTPTTSSLLTQNHHHNIGKVMPASSIVNDSSTERRVRLSSYATVYDQDANNSYNSLMYTTSAVSFVVPLQIYLIDDSPTILKLTKLTLRNMGYTDVQCFENGYVGLQAMKKKFVDIVFTDVQMPILTGPEMTLRFREWEKKLLITSERKQRQVIIALTANTSQELHDMVPSIFDYICTKPIDFSDLRNMICTFCRTMEEKEDFVI